MSGASSHAGATESGPSGSPDRSPTPSLVSAVMAERDPDTSTGRTVIALDIGGTKLAAAIVDSCGGIGGRSTIPTPADGSEAEMWAAVEALVAPLCDVAGTGGSTPTAIGVGCGGPMTAGGVAVSPLNISAWRGFPLLDRLRDRFAMEVAVDNDAKALARAERRWGAAVGERDFMAMVVSTGVGGGIVVGGRLLDGSSGNAGHIGHVIVEPLGRRCECGARGCLEAEVSGTAIERMTGRPAAEAPLDMRQRCGRLVGRAVGSAANLLDLRLAVVAGSVALGFGADFFDAAQTELDRTSMLDFSRGVRIIPAGCGDSGPLLGAAAVALDAAASGATSR
jgi:glucokinase